MLDEKAVAHYRDNGYWLHKKPLINANKFAKLVSLFEGLLATKDEKLRADQLDVPHFTCPALFEFLLADEVLDLVEPFLGPHIGLWSSHLWHCRGDNVAGSELAPRP